MKARRYITAALAILILACPAGAQRTMRGQAFLDLGLRYPHGASVGAGQYLLPGYWEAGLSAMRMTELLRRDGIVNDGLLLEAYHLKLNGGFMYRVASTRSRGLSLYGGAYAWVGIEDIDTFHRLPEGLVLSIDTGRSLVFGATPRLEGEMFVLRRMAVTLGGQVPVAFRSRLRYFTLQGTAGLRFLF